MYLTYLDFRPFFYYIRFDFNCLDMPKVRSSGVICEEEISESSDGFG